MSRACCSSQVVSRSLISLNREANNRPRDNFVLPARASHEPPMSTQIASHETPLPAIPSARSRRVLEIAFLASVVIAYGARFYDYLLLGGSWLVFVLTPAILLAVGMFLYRAGKRSDFFGQAPGGETPASATGN